MNFALNDLLDIPTVQTLLDSWDGISRLSTAVIDTEGTILAATSSQDICTKFHRINPTTIKDCARSGTRIQTRVGELTSPDIYHCPMGMIDSRTPIIVEGKQIGNIFFCQLFLEQPDEAYFIEQAGQYGFDESNYLEAVRKVPLCSEEYLRTNMVFLSGLVQALAEQGLQSKRQLELEREVRENEKKLKVIFDTSEAGIIVVSPLGMITFANRRMADMFGMPMTELVGTYYIDHIHESEKHAGVECMQQIVNGEMTSVELVRHYTRKDGTSFWGNLTGTRFGNVDGSMRDQIMVISDITVRKRAEEEKKLLEQQLRQAQKLESLGALAGGIAHDFNNILTIIMGGCHLMKMDPESAQVQIPTIEKAAERAAELCRQMMSYAGKSPIVHSQVDMGELVDDMIVLLRTTIPKNAAINFERTTTIPFIKGDTSQLNQIVMNLVINASEAIGDVEGEIRVILSTTKIRAGQPEKDNFGNTIPPGWYVCLEVTDNGSGMDDESRRRIFEPFYTTKFAGRGLGMSAIIGIIKGHGGALQLFSRRGYGSIFKIFFPVQLSETVRGKPPLPATMSSWHGSGTILLVDDEEKVVFVMKLMLEKLGFAVIAAINGKEALDLYQEHGDEITLVVTDIGMPVMDGYQLFQELKILNPALPIIIASGFGNSIISSQISRENVAGFIDKPYDFDKIKEIIKNVLDNHCQKQQLTHETTILG
ncbi:MAG: PocR ligand-binding domain-containing protein [Desulfuromonadaceae bacterium]|nr:PocR ligand-binding domain-containing protein [Desulfuromonadaceae bacterium]